MKYLKLIAQLLINIYIYFNKYKILYIFFFIKLIYFIDLYSFSLFLKKYNKKVKRMKL